MPPEGRMIVFAFLVLFFGGFAFGSLHTAHADYLWRNATEVHGVLVKYGSRYRYEYRPAGAAPVIGPDVTDESVDGPEGVVNDWVPLEYDPARPEHLRRHHSRGRMATNFGQFIVTSVAGALFAAAALACAAAFLRAWYEKRQAV